MRIAVSLLLLVASAFAYPIAESESKTPEVPLVITDYSSVSKAEDQVPHAIPHGEVGHQHDSSESSSSESSEVKSTETEKPKEKETSSAESSEEGILHDGIPISTLKPLEEKKEVKPELPKPQESAIKAEASKTDEPIKKEIVQEAKDEKKEEKKEEAIPLLKSLPTNDELKPIQKSEEKGEAVAASEPVPSVRSGLITDKPTEEKKVEVAPAETEEKPLALPTLKKDAPAEPAKAEIAQPSEQKVEATPVAEETVPQLKPNEPLKDSQQLSPSTESPVKEPKSEKKERAGGEEIKPVEILNEKKPEELKPQEIKEPENKIVQKTAEEKPLLENKLDEQKLDEKKVEIIEEKKEEAKKPVEISTVKSAELSNIKAEEKPLVDIPSVKSEESVPLVKSLPVEEKKEIVEKNTPKVQSDVIVPEKKSEDPKAEIKTQTAGDVLPIKPASTEGSILEKAKSHEEVAEKLPLPSASSL